MVIAFLILGIVLGGLLTILTLVFAVISLANGKNKNALVWGIGFVIALVIVGVSIFIIVERISNRVKTGIEWMEEHENTYDTVTAGEYGEEGYQKDERQYWLDTLQKYTNEIYDGKVPADFYVNKPTASDSGAIIKVPFVYPYYIRYNKDTYTGDIMMETSDSIFVRNVAAMAFDQNFAIIKVDNSLSPEMLNASHSETEYLLYDLRTRNYESAANKEKLLDLGRRIGYTGSTELSYLSENFRGWIRYESY